VVSFTPRPLYPRERDPGPHWIGGWVDPRVGLDDMEKWKFLTLSGLELRPLGRPASSQSLYRLRYGGSLRKVRRCKTISRETNILLLKSNIIFPTVRERERPTVTNPAPVVCWPTDSSNYNGRGRVRLLCTETLCAHILTWTSSTDKVQYKIRLFKSSLEWERFAKLMTLTEPIVGK
jgi:hypothetical protein